MKSSMKYKESKLAHKFLDGLSGLEIGGSAHNSFGLNSKNVDYTDKEDTVYKLDEIKRCGRAMPVDVVASGDKLPFPDGSHDFVISSHVLEHFPDPIKALKEWYRVIKDGGYIFMIVPHKERTFDKKNDRTTLKELIARHSGSIKVKKNYEKHHSVWITEDVVELVQHLGWRIVFVQDTDDKAKNGFTVVVQKGKYLIDPTNISNELKTTLWERFGCLLRSESDLDIVLQNFFEIDRCHAERIIAIEKKSDKEISDLKKRINEMLALIKNNKQEISQLKKQIEIMESSKFWKLRNRYIQLKQAIWRKN